MKIYRGEKSHDTVPLSWTDTFYSSLRIPDTFYTLPKVAWFDCSTTGGQVHSTFFVKLAVYIYSFL
jgi:hypothetical protein